MLLKIRNLTKTYPAQRTWRGTIKDPAFHAVNNVSFNVEKGEILGLLGPNGAGKTTIVHMLTNLLTPTKGNISYFGKKFPHEASTIMERVGFAPAYAKLPGNLTVWENLTIYARLYGLNKGQREHRVKKLLNLLQSSHLRDKKTATLSAGQLTSVMLAKAFLHHPLLVILDEPTAALDPEAAQTVRSFIQQQKDSGVSFLFTSHNMYEVTELCDRVIVLKEGEIIADSTPLELARTVKKSHLDLLITKNQKDALGHAREHRIPYELRDRHVIFTLDEQDVALFLQELARLQVHYIHIDITKPSLEDYFMSLKEEDSL